VWKVDKNKGTSTAAINPFSSVSGVNATNTFVASPLTADANGNIYYKVIELNTNGNPWANDVLGAWLVEITRSDTSSMVAYSTIVLGGRGARGKICPAIFFGAG